MATHSSVLAWRIPGTGEPGGLPSVCAADFHLSLEETGTSLVAQTVRNPPTMQETQV